MARDIGQRLEALKARRSGTDRLGGLTMDQMQKAFEGAAYADSYETRAGENSFTKYALGAMQEVGPDYTRISLETAERVGNQLAKGLSDAGYEVEFRLQGSVPANIHIRGYSDVDLLTLRTDFYTYDRYGPRSLRGGYTNPTSLTTPELLSKLWDSSAQILKSQFPATTVDTSGSKAVKISGGSLPRTVDVVPSHWHDTVAYQATYAEIERAVTIYDRKASKPIDNLPFKHIKLLSDRDYLLGATLKKAIRLCKNVKCDAEDEIGLSSFEIASLIYHADQAALLSGVNSELSILGEAQRFWHRSVDGRAGGRRLGKKPIRETGEVGARGS